MKENDIFIEVDCFQKNKSGNIVCGDSFMSQKLKDEGRMISVLSDGLGSGIKASVLSTMTVTMAMNYTAMNESILQSALSIINTLPQDQVRKISYSTFCIFDINYFGHTKVIEYESPAVYLFRRGEPVAIQKTKIPIERKDLENTFLWVSEFKLEKEDRLICFSDGVSQSGMGTATMPFGWDAGVEQFISGLLKQQPDISAQELSRKIVLRAERNDNYRLLDDCSCCVVYRRTPRNLLICTGPPYDEKKDRYLAEKVRDFKGKRILCGGTTATIISRELNLPLTVSLQVTDKELPPLSYLEGIDLVTEGILTLSKVERLLSQGNIEKSQGPANELVSLLQNSDQITFIVGTRINIAHQDPNLPVELEIRRNVVKKIKFLLETKFLKDVEISYL
ncbi:MAG: SpoIIE family protein phosphatase [Odoribacter sp.]